MNEDFDYSMDGFTDDELITGSAGSPLWLLRKTSPCTLSCNTDVNFNWGKWLKIKATAFTIILNKG